MILLTLHLAVRSGGYYMFEDTQEEAGVSFHETATTDDKRTLKDVTKLLIQVTSFTSDKKVDDQENPGTSKYFSKLSDNSMLKQKSAVYKRIELFLTLCTNLLLLLAIKLHKISRKYSYVMKILDAEKKKLKVN